MKSVVVIISCALVFILGAGWIYFHHEYQSAFEADQQCHFELKKIISDNANLGCDHDMETNQWILYQSGNESKPAIVLQRFRY